MFGKFKAIIKETDEADRHAQDLEVDDIIARYTQLCTLLDGLFSLARTPSGKATQPIIDLTGRYIRAVMFKWRGLRLSMKLLKIHGIEDHLLPQMERFKGIGDFLEDFIEQAHQFGKDEEARTRNMPNRERAALSHSRWERAGQHTAVVKAKEEMKQKTTRKRKDPPIGDVSSARKKGARDKRRLDCLNLIDYNEPPVDDTVLKTMLEYFEEATGLDDND